MAKRRVVSPRVSEHTVNYFSEIEAFKSLNAAAEFAVEVFPFLYKKTLIELKGKFSKTELSLLIEVISKQGINSKSPGIHLITNVSNTIALDKIDKKWSVDAGQLIRRLKSLTCFQIACMELWAFTFQYEKIDLKKYVKELTE